jgi:nucleotide-binding universal stress UspA family protein
MKKILIAIDNSAGSLKALDYVGRQFSRRKDIQITLFHVLLGEPPEFWDDGHILTKEEKKTRKNVIKKWSANKNKVLDPMFEKAIEVLTGQGIPAKQIQTKFSIESLHLVPQCIVGEAKAGGYETIIIGRSGRSNLKHILLGSIANKIINSARRIAVCVVD